MQSLRHFKRMLKASSLMESVIAISIISICGLVAFLVYLNVISQNKSVHYYKAKHNVEFLTYESEKLQDYDEEVFKYSGYTITKKVNIDEETYTAILSFLIKTGNKEYQINKLIPYNE